MVICGFFFSGEAVQQGMIDVLEWHLRRVGTKAFQLMATPFMIYFVLVD